MSLYLLGSRASDDRGHRGAGERGHVRHASSERFVEHMTCLLNSIRT